MSEGLSIPQKHLEKPRNVSNENISSHSLQHLIKITLIFIAQLNAWLLFEK